MSPVPSPHDPFEAYPDVVAALAAAVPSVPPPARLKERLDARLREFARERAASSNLLSRPVDGLRERVLSGPGGRRRAKGKPLARIVVGARGREAAFFCWYLPPHERFDLVFEREDGTVTPAARFDTDGSGDGEVPYLSLPSGRPLTAVSLRRASSGETVLAARL